MPRLEVVRDNKVMFVNTDVLGVVEKELVAFVRKWHKPPNALLLGPPEYMALVAEWERNTGQKPPRGEQMAFHNIPVMPKTKPGWDFIPPPSLTHYFVPGLMQYED